MFPMRLYWLTVMHAVNSFSPVSGDIHQGLDVLNDLFGKLFYENELPTDHDWLDHLDILDAVRLSPFSSLKIQQYYPEILPGYVLT